VWRKRLTKHRDWGLKPRVQRGRNSSLFELVISTNSCFSHMALSPFYFWARDQAQYQRRQFTSKVRLNRRSNPLFRITRHMLCVYALLT
jgi:hypothetical protein